MTLPSKAWMRAVLWGLGALLLADALLVAAAVLSAGPEGGALQGQLDRLREEHALLKADVDRGREIRQRLPDVGRECDDFYRQQLAGSESGYAQIIEDLGRVAGRAGLRATNISFRENALDTRGVNEISVSLAVEGDYPSLVRFVNGLERSENFYLLDGLSLSSATAGGVIRLGVELRTYFRM